MFDIQEYYSTAFPVEIPTWHTQNVIVFKHEAFILRKFGEGEALPTLVVPPQASHSSHIADYDKNQSMIETVMKNRAGPIYCIEWLSCTYARRNEAIDDLVKQLRLAHQCIDSPVHLIGLCQGGWLAAIYTSLYQESVASLTLTAAPIDFHGESGVIPSLVKDSGMAPYSLMVAMHGGIMPGYLMLMGWKLMHPVQSFLGDYVNIANELLEKKDVSKIKKFRIWYEYVQDLAGAWYLEAVENLFLKNKLIKKELVILDQVIDLANITCPLSLITGEHDEITLVEHLNNIIKYASSKVIHKVTIKNCGHIGCFMGTKSQEYIAQSVNFMNHSVSVTEMKSEFGSLASLAP